MCKTKLEIKRRVHNFNDVKSALSWRHLANVFKANEWAACRHRSNPMTYAHASCDGNGKRHSATSKTVQCRSVNTHVSGGHLGVVGRIEPCHRVVENVQSVGRHLAVVLDALKPEPDGVAAVVARTAAAPEEVGNEAVAQAASVAKDEDASLVEARRYQHEATHRDKCVATPVAEDAMRKVRQT